MKHQRIFAIIALFALACSVLLNPAGMAIAATPAVAPLSLVEQPQEQETQEEVTIPSSLTTQSQLEQFWLNLYEPGVEPGVEEEGEVESRFHTGQEYLYKLLAKAQPDECYNGIGVPYTGTLTLDCDFSQPKVNQAYVWGLTDYEDTLWFGTAPNVHCLVQGAFLGLPLPTETNSYVCEYGQSQFAQSPLTPPAFDIIGDWRPPKLYRYDRTTKELDDITPTLAVSRTLGIRSAGTVGDYVFFGGPTLGASGINLFVFDATTSEFLGAETLPGYANIRKWLELDGELYAAVGNSALNDNDADPNNGPGGSILRYTGNPADPATRFDFEVVGELDSDGAEIIEHEGRIVVNTWPSFGADSGTLVYAGIWMSELVPVGGLTNANAGNWKKIFDYGEYDPDPLVAATYGGGALASYGGDLYFGTMHVPFLAAVAHLNAYFNLDGDPGDPRPPADTEDIVGAILGTYRAINIFRLTEFDFDLETDTIEVVYGLPVLPAFDPGNPIVDGDEQWLTIPNGMDDPNPIYGLSGFGNFFNNYTWSMAVYDEQLFVGTMDWSYLLADLLEGFFEGNDILAYPLLELPEAFVGADLMRFPAPDAPAAVEHDNGVGNYTNYGVRNMLADETGLYLGMANPMNLMTDPEDLVPEGGWELIRVSNAPLSVTVTGDGSGSVISDPAGIACGITCTTQFQLGAAVILTATADAGSIFTGWEGACSGTDACELNMWDEREVTAIFRQAEYPVTVALAGNGLGSVTSDPTGIACGFTCTAPFDLGATLYLTPTAALGSSFTGWAGACSGTLPCAITIDQSEQVTATFTLNQYDINVNKIGSGNVNTEPAGIGCGQGCFRFDYGTPVTVTAVASQGFSFIEWDGACTGEETCQITVTANAEVIATFDADLGTAGILVEGNLTENSPINFTATLPINPVQTCDWDFGDGSGDACATESSGVGVAGVDAVYDVTIQATHVYTESGTYTVTVMASNAAGTAAASTTVIIAEPTGENPIEQPGRNGLYLPMVIP